MRTVADILATADRIAPLARAASWDPVGLQLGDVSAAASTVGLCHEVTDAIVEAAIAGRLDALVSYHPLLFRSTRSLTADSGANGRAFRLISGGVALIVVHTAADAVDGGTADSLAADLGLGDVQPFGPMWPTDAVKIVTFTPRDHVDAVRAAMAAAGAGQIGRYASCSFEIDGHGTFVPQSGASPFSGTHGEMSRESEIRLEMVAPAGRADAVVAALVSGHPYDEPAYDVIPTRSNAGFVGRHGALSTSVVDLAALVGERLGSRPKIAGGGPVERVAVVPGSGGDFMAAASGVADVIVTGDVSHHEARAALDRGLAVIDPGHAATERPGVASLYASLAAELGDIVDLTGIPVSPWEDG
jgi:dinuclear metal center YbgI/SA1388 family protein